MKHLKILLIVTVIGMTLMGVGYATWTDEVVIGGRVTIAELEEPEIIDLVFRPKELGKFPWRNIVGDFYYILSNGQEKLCIENFSYIIGPNRSETYIIDDNYKITFTNDNKDGLTWEIKTSR